MVDSQSVLPVLADHGADRGSRVFAVRSFAQHLGAVAEWNIELCRLPFCGVDRLDGPKPIEQLSVSWSTPHPSCEWAPGLDLFEQMGASGSRDDGLACMEIIAMTLRWSIISH